MLECTHSSPRVCIVNVLTCTDWQQHSCEQEVLVREAMFTMYRMSLGLVYNTAAVSCVPVLCSKVQEQDEDFCNT